MLLRFCQIHSNYNIQIVHKIRIRNTKESVSGEAYSVWDKGNTSSSDMSPRYDTKTPREMANTKRDDVEMHDGPNAFGGAREEDNSTASKVTGRRCKSPTRAERKPLPLATSASAASSLAEANRTRLSSARASTALGAEVCVPEPINFQVHVQDIADCVVPSEGIKTVQDIRDYVCKAMQVETSLYNVYAKNSLLRAERSLRSTVPISVLRNSKCEGM